MKDDLLMQSRERHRLLCGDAAIVTAAELALLDAIAESAEMNTNTQSYWNWVRKQKYPRSMQLAADAVDLFGQQWLQEKASCELVQGRIETACQPEKLRHLAGILIDVAFTVAPNIGEDEIKDLRGIISELTALAHDCTDVSETKLTASCGTSDDERPAHYGGPNDPYEAIKVIEAWHVNFNLGNTLKYISRYRHKGEPLRDLKKARFYLDREIAAMEQRGSAQGCPQDQAQTLPKPPTQGETS